MALSIGFEFDRVYLMWKNFGAFMLLYKKGHKFPKSTEYSSEQVGEISKIIYDDILHPGLAEFKYADKMLKCVIKIKYEENYHKFSYFYLDNREKYEILPNYDKTKNKIIFHIDDLKYVKHTEKPKLLDYVRTYVENKSLFINFIFDDYSEFNFPEINDFVEFDDYLEFDNNLNELFYGKDIFVQEILYNQNKPKKKYKSVEKHPDPCELREDANFSIYGMCLNSKFRKYLIFIHIFNGLTEYYDINLELTPKKKIKSAN